MNTKVIDIFKKIRKEYGNEIFHDYNRLNPLSMDYAEGQYKGEITLLSMLLKEGFYKDIINNPDDCVQICIRYRMRMKKDFFWNEEQIEFAMNSWLAIMDIEHRVCIAENSKETEAQEGVKVVNDNGNLGFKDYLMAAERGDLDAQNELGRCYVKGDGVLLDYKLGAEWFSKAADRGHAGAQRNLGMCYFRGDGVLQNSTKAFELFLKAALQGNSDSQFFVGWCYKHGEGVSKDHIKAVEFFLKAAEQGHAEAQFNLGKQFSYGLGVLQDDKKAAEWFYKAAEQGYTDAQVSLGLLYKYGRGVMQNSDKAFELIVRAAEQGNEDAIRLINKASKRS